jgi:hypothetical protein
MSAVKKFRDLLKSGLTRYSATRRLYEWPYSMARPAKFLLGRVICRLFPRWTKQQLKLAVRYIIAGEGHKAIAIADGVLACKPDLYDYSKFVGFASIYWLQGRSDAALRLFQQIEARRHEVARAKCSTTD